jgi:hypothetical protein
MNRDLTLGYLLIGIPLGLAVICVIMAAIG